MTGESISILVTKGESPGWQGFEYQKSGALFVTSENVRDGSLDISSPKFIPMEFHRKLRRSALLKNDILINLVGASIGRSCLFCPDTVVEANINQAVCLLRAGNSVEPKWVSFYLQEPSTVKRLVGNNGDSARANISLGDIRSFHFLVPPLPEQRKIADILTTWDEALGTLDSLIAANDRRKQALIQQLLTGKRRLKGYDRSGGKTKSDRFGVYPADWKQVALADIIQEVSARNAGGRNLPVLSCTKHRGLVLSQEYFGKRVHAEDTSGYRVVRRGEFAYATNHIEEGSIGYQNLVDAGLVSPIYTVFKTNGEIDDNYLFRVLKSPLLIHFYRINTSASVDRRGSLRYDEFSRIRIWLPSKPEQLAIAAILETADQELTLLRAQRQTLDQQKRGLMQRLLTGKVRVKVPTK